MKQYLNILLSLFLTITSCQPTFAQTKVDGSLLKGDVIGGTASNTRRIVVPKDTKANLDAKTRLEANLVYGTDTKKAYIDNGTDLVAVGSGSGGETNYIVNGDADGASASIFTPYADAAATRPVDGTGGSPTVTTSITSTVPLMGTKSYLLTKPASNVQGQGWAIPFTVDLGYRAKASKITVQYIVNSGTFVAGSDSTESDVIWYLYDVTNSLLIEPSNIKMRASNTSISDQYDAEFQTSATGSSYRLIAHVQSTSALAYELKVDDIKITPNKVTLGPVNSDPQNATCAASWTTNTTTTCKIERDGGFASIEWNVALSGAPNATALSVSLPAGMTVDMSRLVSVGAGYPIHGTASSNRAGSATTVYVLMASTTSFYITYSSNTTTWAQSIVSNTAPVTWGSGDNIMARIRVPITGWGSSQRISDGYDGRDLRVNVQRAASLTGVNPNNSTVKIAIAPSIIDDSYAGWDAANNRILIKSSKTYDVSFSLGVDIANQVASNYISARVRKNGTTDVAVSNQQATGVYMGLTGSAVGIPLVAGDYLELFLNGTANNSVSTLTVNTIAFNVSARQAAQTIAASEKVKSTITQSSGQSISNTTITKLQGTVSKDTHGIWSIANSEWTQPRAGTGKIYGSYHVDIGSTTSTIDSYLYKNGTVYQRKTLTINATANPYPIDFNWAIDGVAGDKWDLRVQQNTGTTRTILANTNFNQVTFELD